MIGDWEKLIICERNIENLELNLTQYKENHNYLTKIT